jgi:hypothetical protein
MTPLEDPGVQNGLIFLEHAPLIGVLIAIPIIIIGIVIKHYVRRNNKRR